MRTGFSASGFPIYFEVREPSAGSARAPLLLIHGGGSTIESNWGAALPLLVDRTTIAVELQGHGHTESGSRLPSFTQSADDVAALLGELALGPVDVLGFSNGGQVALQLAARRPELVRRAIFASAPFRRDGMIEGFWQGLEASTFDDMPSVFVDADFAASGDHTHARAMYDLDRNLMLGFTDWSDELPASVAAPALVVVGDRDVVTVAHAARLAELIPDARLLCVPATHGSYLGEIAASGGNPGELHAALPYLTGFLDAP